MCLIISVIVNAVKKAKGVMKPNVVRRAVHQKAYVITKAE